MRVTAENKLAGTIEDARVWNATGVAWSGTAGHDGILDLCGLQDLQNRILRALLTLEADNDEASLFAGLRHFREVGKARDARTAIHAPLLDNNDLARERVLVEGRLVDRSAPLDIGKRGRWQFGFVFRGGEDWKQGESEEAGDGFHVGARWSYQAGNVVESRTYLEIS